MKKASAILMAISLAVFVLCTGVLLRQHAENANNADAFTAMSHHLQSLITAQAEGTSPDPMGEAAREPSLRDAHAITGQAERVRRPLFETHDPVVLALREMAQTQPDLAGWLRIDGTKVDYPVMRSAEEPERYLHLNFDGEYSRAGTPFMLPVSDPAVPNENITLYGHHMKDGSMFGELPKYESKDVYDAQPFIRFDTLHERGLYKIIAVFRTSIGAETEFPYYLYEWLESEAMFNRFMQGVEANRLYDTGETAAYGDRLLSLSTCDYRSPNGRFVIVAKRVEESIITEDSVPLAMPLDGLLLDAGAQPLVSGFLADSESEPRDGALLPLATEAPAGFTPVDPFAGGEGGLLLDPDVSETSQSQPMPQAEAPTVWTRADEAPLNVRDVLWAMGHQPSIVDAVTVRFSDEDQPVPAATEASTVTLAFHFALPDGVAAHLRAGDWYEIDLPDLLVPLAAQQAALTHDGAEFAHYVLENGRIRLVFAPAIADLGPLYGSLSIDTIFAPGAFAAGDRFTLFFPAEGNGGVSVSFDTAPADASTEEASQQDTHAIASDILLLTEEPTSTLPPDGAILDMADSILKEGLLLQDAPDDAAPGADMAEPIEGADILLPIQAEASTDPVASTAPSPTAQTVEDANALLLSDAAQTAPWLHGQGLVTAFSIRFLNEGRIADAPPPQSEVELTLALTLTEALQAQLRSAGGYAIPLPQALVVPAQTATIAFDGGIVASASVGTDNTARLSFSGLSDADEALPLTVGTLILTAGFDTDSLPESGEITLTLPGEEEANTIAVSLDMGIAAAAFAAPADPWTRTDDTPMSVKEIYRLLGLSPTSILDDMHLTYQEPGGGALSSTEATVNAAIDFRLALQIPGIVTQNLREGDTYAIDLPDAIRIEQGDSYELRSTLDPTGPSYATATVSTDGRVLITFHDAVRTLGEAEGDFHFSASFYRDAIDTPGDHVIQLPNEPEDLQVTVNILSSADQSVDKTGTLDRQYNPGQVTWNVDFNKPVSTLHNAVLTDPMPDGLTLSGAQVFAIATDVDGNVLPGSEAPLDASAYTVSPDGTVRIVGPLTSAVRVRYTADITGDTSDGGNYTFANTATLVTDDFGPITGSASVTAQYGRFLEKRNTGYDAVNQRFSWEIRYNYGENHIAQADATLTDTLTGEGMVFDADSVVVRAVTISANGTPSLGDVLDPSLYTVSFDGDQMVIAFGQDLTQAVNISYATHIEGVVDSSGVSYRNDVTTTWGGTAHATGATKPTIQQNIVKTLYNADDVNRILTWVVRINRPMYLMENWTMTDTVGTGLYFTSPELIALRDLTEGTTMQPGTDYSADVAADNKSITVTLLGDYAAGTDSEMELVYYTRYDDTAPQTVSNTVTNSWNEADGTPHTSTSEGHYPRTPVDVTGGEKNGSYNAVTKEITWTMLVNYHQMSFHPAVLTDPISGNQQYIHDSLHIYQNVNGAIGNEIDIGAFGVTVEEPSATNGPTLTLTFPGSAEDVGVSLWIVFRTSLAGQIVGEESEYTNEAVFTANGHDYPLRGTVSIQHGGSLVDKSGQQSSDGYVHWTATLNPSQSTLKAPTLTDTPSANQRIDMDSLALYRTYVDAQGNITTNTRSPLVPGTDYTATYADDGTGQWVLTIQINGTIDTALVMQYRSSVYLTSQTGTVSNHIHLAGSNEGNTNTDETETQLPVRVYEGGGTLYGASGQVTIRKLGTDGGPLAGAVLMLVDARGNRIGPVTTGETGEVRFTGIVQGTYTLYELSAPDGYTVSEALADGMAIVVDAETTAGTRTIAARNEPTRASLRKVGEMGEALAGAVFHLERRDESGQYVPYGTEQLISGDDGMVHVTGLPPGQYRFVEDTPPDGYVKTNQTREFTLEADGRGVVPAQHTGDLINYQGRLTLIKTDVSGAPLAGAEFTVYRADGGVFGRYLSGADGTIEVNGLAPGRYMIRETRAPEGYRLTSDPRVITIPETAQAQPIATLGSVVNGIAEGGLFFHKIDGDTGAPLANAAFALMNAAGQEVARATTDSTGEGFFEAIPVGEYRLVEVVTPVGYIRNTAEISVTIEAAADGGIAPVDIGTVENYQGRVQLQKENEAGAPLAGAVFTLTDDDTGAIVATYQTGRDGMITIYGLAPGNYLLRETQAPDGYLLEDDPRRITIPQEAEGPLPMIRLGPVVNPPATGSVLFRKTDGSTGAQLAGAVFRVVSRPGGRIMADVTTGALGNGEVNGLPPGDYTLMELSAPAGYLRNTQVWDFTITRAADGSVGTVSLGALPNYRGSITLQKTDETGTGLGGAVFTLYRIGGGVVGTFETEPGGALAIDGLAPGTYRLRETQAPAGYALQSDPLDFTIPAEAEGPLPPHSLGARINPPLLGGIRLHKIDGDTGAPLAGAVFDVTNVNTGAASGEMETDENGLASLDGLAPGAYRLTERTAPQGYIRNTRTWGFTVSAEPDGSIAPMDLGTLENHQGKVQVIKRDNNAAPLAGAVFTLTDEAGASSRTFATDVQGIAEIYGLAPGTYTLRETRAPEGYALVSDPYRITIPETYQGTLPMLTMGPVVNQRAFGAVLFRKVDAETGALLGGATFQLIRRDTGETVAEVVSAAGRETMIGSLDPGAYRLIERSAPDGYVRDTQYWDFSVAAGLDGSIAPLYLGEVANGQGRVRIAKTDEAGNPLSGAQFTLYRISGGVVGTYETGADGIIELDGLAPGDYRLRETRAPQGYALSSDPRDFRIPEAAWGVLPTLTLPVMTNQPLAGGIQFHKVDGDTGAPLAGAVFRLVDAQTGDEVARVTTGETGAAFIEGVAPGAYRLIEVTPPAGYILNTRETTVTITANPDGSIAPIDIGALYNHQGKVTLTKVDENGDPLAGATFTLHQGQRYLGSHVTDAQGLITLYGLAPGTYRLRESRAPEGYATSPDPMDFTIADAHAGTLPMLTLGPVRNLPLSGAIFLRKVDADTNTRLRGAVFQVIRQSTGTEVTRFTTDADGVGYADNLPPGAYRLVELTAPTGYIRMTDPIDFVIEAGPDGSIAPIDLGDIANSQGRIRLLKVDADGNPLAGAAFILTRADGAMLGRYTTDVNGILEIYRLAPGSYRIREAEAPRGYALSDDPLDFTIPASVPRSLPILTLGPVVNERTLGILMIQKVDAETGVALAGAQFRVTGSDGSVIGRFTTGADGIATVNGLTAGVYQVLEVVAPQGYQLNPNSVRVEITEQGQGAPVQVTVANPRLANVPTPSPSPSPTAAPWPTVPPWGPPQTGDTGSGPWASLMALSGLVFLGSLTALLLAGGRRERGSGNERRR